MYKTIAIIALFLAFAASTTNAFAVETPQFSSCYAPGGTLIASYGDGQHGIPGDTKTYSGTDTVYQLNTDMVLQCLCPIDTNGIRTEWWKATNISDNDISILTKQGWIYITSGAAWGLDDHAYLARNSSYSCNEHGIGGGSVLGASTQTGSILGASTLAGTGTMLYIVGLIAVGLLLVISATQLKRAK